MRIAFTGDILSYPSQDKIIKKLGSNKGSNKEYIPYFERVSPLFKDCDYVVGSLETTCSGAKLGFTRDCSSFNTPESILNALKYCGFDLMTTANNHCLDRGLQGLNNTIDNLINAGLDYTGTFKNNNSKPFLIKKICGVKVAFVAYTYGTNSENNGCVLSRENQWRVNLFRRQIVYKRSWYKPLAKSFLSLFLGKKGSHGGIQQDCAPVNEIENTLNDNYINAFKSAIFNAKKEADLVFCLLHIGGQFNAIPGQYTKDIVQLASDCGADAIVCNHSHTVQKIDFNNTGKVFAWALGNFSFTPNEGYYVANVYADYSIVLYCDICENSKQIKDVSFSVCKSVITSKGVQVVPVYDLYQELNDEEKVVIAGDLHKVVEKVAGHTIDEKLEILSEYRVKGK